MTLNKKETIESIKTEWKRLWEERLDDKIRAEGVATDNYSIIFVEKGTIIHATKDYKALNLREIIKKHEIENPERYISPDPKVGGWTKFIKSRISKNHNSSSRKNLSWNKDLKKQPSRKSGRGWLNK